MNPINLKTEFGDKWQIGLDEAANGRSDDPWNYIVRCRYGHLYPVDGGRIGAATDCTGVALRKLAAIVGVDLFQDGEGGPNVVFPLAKLRYIARVMKPKSVRQPSPAQGATSAPGRLPENPLD